jgi:YesN/AraC family two-component response regulator
VDSTKGEGTTFFVYLQTGDDHLSQMEKVPGNDHQLEGAVSSSYLSEELQFFSTGPDEDTDKDGLALPNHEKAHLLLIVEDNLDLRKYMREILEDQFEVITARDGAEAWEVVQRDLPDLVISDVMMPHMNGLELTAHIKKDLKTCHIPVVLLTAKTSVENKLEGLEAGADSYIPKPFNERHLMIRVRKLLEMRNRINEHYKEHLSFSEIENPVGRMDQRFLDKTAKLIEDHINDQAFGVEELSREIGMSRVHLYRKVKQITGFSVSDYVRSVKLRVAKQLIRNGKMNISEVAYASGFSNPSYFTKCFKSQFNQSPSEYQSQFTKH